MDVRKLEGKKVLFVPSEDREVRPIQGWDIISLDDPVIISEEGERGSIVAIDSSVVHIAETDDGSVYGAKAALVVYDRGEREIHRVGPFLLYLNEENAREIASCFNSNVHPMLLLLDRQAAMKSMRLIMERSLASFAISYFKSRFILLDGSLRLSVFEPKWASLDILLSESKDATLVGISKASRIKLVNRLASSISKVDLPCYIEITKLIKSLIRPSLGRSYLVKLDRGGLVFRIDLPSHVDPSKAFPSLRNSDILNNGYPESLKIAHLVSIFTQAEIAGVKGIIASKARDVLMTEDIRRLVLGSLRL